MNQEQEFKEWLKENASLPLDLSPKNGKRYRAEEFYKVVKIGDHVAIPFYLENILSRQIEIAYHHGIYVKEGIFIDNNKDRESSIQETSMEDFFELNDTHLHEFYIVHYEMDCDLIRQHAIEYAYYRLQRPDNTSELYHFFSFNCEGFATMCWTGKNRSVKNIIDEACVQ